MTRKFRKKGHILLRGNVNVLCVQELMWKGNKVRKVEGGYKFFYSATSERDRTEWELY